MLKKITNPQMKRGHSRFFLLNKIGKMGLTVAVMSLFSLIMSVQAFGLPTVWIEAGSPNDMTCGVESSFTIRTANWNWSAWTNLRQVHLSYSEVGDAKLIYYGERALTGLTRTSVRKNQTSKTNKIRARTDKASDFSISITGVSQNGKMLQEGKDYQISKKTANFSMYSSNQCKNPLPTYQDEKYGTGYTGTVFGE